MKESGERLGDYNYEERPKVVNAISAGSIHLVHLSLTEDICIFEMTSAPLARYDERIHKEQWASLVQSFWPPSKKLVAEITKWKFDSVAPTRFRVIEDTGNHCRCHFHGFDFGGFPCENLQIYVHTIWLDSERGLENDFVDLSFLINETRDLENTELLPRRQEIMKALEGFRTSCESFLSELVRFMLDDQSLEAYLHPLEVEADYDHESYCWSFMMKGVVR